MNTARFIASSWSADSSASVNAESREIFYEAIRFTRLSETDASYLLSVVKRKR